MITDVAKLDPKVHAPTEEQLKYLDFAFRAAGAPPKRFRKRSEMASAELAAEVTTLGWDSNYVLRVADANKVLEKSHTPTDFEIMVEPNENYGIKGKFGSWRIGLGGSGGIIFLAVKVAEGTMTMQEKTYPFNDSTVYISVKLKYIPQITTKRKANELEVTQDLKVDPVERSDIDPAVVVQNLVFSGTPPNAFTKALMVGALEQWFRANIIQFAYIFSTINLNKKAADQNFQWLQPTYSGYAYFDGLTEDSAYFGVLNMTDQRSPEGLSYQIGPKSIPDGSRAGFNISMERYMEKVIFPGLVKGFPHASSSSFTPLSRATMQIFPGISGSSGSWWSPSPQSASRSFRTASPAVSTTCFARPCLLHATRRASSNGKATMRLTSSSRVSTTASI
jgi:hypothetical protein